MQTLNRRKFLVSAGVLAAALPLGASAFDFIPVKGKGFDFVLFGDLHFDKLEHHDMEYLKVKYPNDIVQVVNYSKITRENLPQLMKVAREKGRKHNADFYLQLGDFTEGLCGSEQLATTQMQEFISFVKGQSLKRPFFVVKGNHDITGEGAREVYAKKVHPWQTAELKKPMAGANATFVHKNARFVLFDCYTAEESLKWLKGVLAEHKEELLFFCVHEPIVPFNARSTWHVFSKPQYQKQREELLNLLGRHNAIVLSGHLHKTSVLTRSTPEGNFVQVGLGSVVPVGRSGVKDHLDGLQHYNESLVNLEPKFSPNTLEERKAILLKESAFIRHFEYADFCGYGTVNVTHKNEVGLSIYVNTETEPWKTVNLTKLLKAEGKVAQTVS